MKRLLWPKASHSNLPNSWWTLDSGKVMDHPYDEMCTKHYQMKVKAMHTKKEKVTKET